MMKKINDIMPNLRVDQGFFKYFTNTYANLNATTLSLLFAARSGNKPISSFLSYYITEQTPVLDTTNERQIASVLENAFGEKWARMGAALEEQYQLLDEYSEIITKDLTYNDDTTTTKNKGAISRSFQYGQTEETLTKGAITEQDNYGASTRTLQYGQTQETYNKGSETKANSYGEVTVNDNFGGTTTTVSNSTNGFNGGLVPSDTSQTQVGSHQDTHTTSSHSDSETTTYGTTTTQNSQHTDTIGDAAKTDSKSTTFGNDTKTKAQHTDTQTEQARVDSDVVDGVKTETGTITKTGRKTPAQELLEKELELRKFDLFKQILKDIDSILCLKIYE